jgi:hypothetical protein
MWGQQWHCLTAMHELMLMLTMMMMMMLMMLMISSWLHRPLQLHPNHNLLCAPLGLLVQCFLG